MCIRDRKNPNALTFTGGATGSYDGSSPLSIAIPDAGSGGANIVAVSYTHLCKEI